MKKILTNNIGFKLLSLLFAIVLWIIVVNIDDPEITRTIQGIPVTILDEGVVTENKQVYEVVSGQEVTVTVKGPRSMVDKITKDYFYAYAPFSEKSNVDAVPIYVQFRNSKYDKDCQITQKTMTMKLNIENVIEKSFNVEIVHSADVPSGYYLGKEGISPETVVLTGPESIVNQVHSINTRIDLSGRTQDFQVSVPLRCYTDSGTELSLNAETSLSVQSVDYYANIYSVREVPVTCGYTGKVANGYELIDVNVDKSTVKIAGPSVSQLDSIVIPDEILNVSEATQNVSVETDISTLIPEGVYLCNSSDEVVKVTAKIEPIINNTYTLPVSEIDKVNIPDGYNAEIVDRNVNIVLSGLEDKMTTFSVNEIEPYVDLRNTVEGNNEVLVRFTLSEGLSLVQEVKVNVVLTKINETTTNGESTENTVEPAESQSSELQTTIGQETS